MNNMKIPFLAVYIKVNHKEEHYGIVMVDYKDNTINYHNCDVEKSDFTVLFNVFKPPIHVSHLNNFLKKNKMIPQDRGVSLGYLEQHIKDGSAMCDNIRNYHYVRVNILN